MDAVVVGHEQNGHSASAGNGTDTLRPPDPQTDTPRRVDTPSINTTRVCLARLDWRELGGVGSTVRRGGALIVPASVRGQGISKAADVAMNA